MQFYDNQRENIAIIVVMFGSCLAFYPNIIAPIPKIFLELIL
jgi:hypothetical protein